MQSNTPTDTSNAPLRGIAFVIMATLFFVILDMGVKKTGTFAPAIIVMSGRYIFQLLVTLAWRLPLDGKQLFKTHNPRLQVLRGLLLGTTTLLSYIALQCLPLAEFTAIVAVTPIVTTVFAVVFLKEAVSRFKWLALAVSLCGALMIVGITTFSIGPAALLPLLAVVIYSAFHIITGRLSAEESVYTSHFYTGLVAVLLNAVLLLIFTPQDWAFLQQPQFWSWILVVGFFGSFGHYWILMAYRHASATTLTPYLYSQIVFATLVGWLAFSQIPEGWSFLGMALIVLAGLANIWFGKIQENKKESFNV